MREFNITMDFGGFYLAINGTYKLDILEPYAIHIINIKTEKGHIIPFEEFDFLDIWEDHIKSELREMYK